MCNLENKLRDFVTKFPHVPMLCLNIDNTKCNTVCLGLSDSPVFP